MFKKLMDLASTYSFYTKGIKFGNDFIVRAKTLEALENSVITPHEANMIDTQYNILIKDNGTFFKMLKSILADDNSSMGKKDFAFFLYSFKDATKFSQDLFKNESSLFFDSQYDQVIKNLFKILENGQEFASSDKLIESARQNVEHIKLPDRRSWEVNKKLVLNLTAQALLLKNIDIFNNTGKLDMQSDAGYFVELKGIIPQLYIEKMDKIFEVVLTRTVFEYMQGNFSEYNFFKKELFARHSKHMDIVTDKGIKNTLFVPSKIMAVMPAQLKKDFNEMHTVYIKDKQIIEEQNLIVNSDLEQLIQNRIKKNRI